MSDPGRAAPPTATGSTPAPGDDHQRPSATAQDTPGELTDHELVAAHVAGDPMAFATLFQRHRDRLWAVALRTIGDREEAADALQDAMLSAFRRAEGFRGEAAVTTWLHRIVVNACLDRVRRRQARPSEPLPEREEALAELGVVDEDQAVASERRLDVMSALRTLAPEQRQALVLVDMEGYSVQEAADLLGCAVGTVKSRCARGRARLAPLVAHLRNRSALGDVQPVMSTDLATSHPAGHPADPPRVSERSTRPSSRGGGSRDTAS